MPELKWCQHCKHKIARRPRGLCDLCYYNTSIRHLYEPAYPQIATSGLSLPLQPTKAHPGSPEKISVFCERVDRGEYLFHPHDFNALLVRFKELNID